MRSSKNHLLTRSSIPNKRGWANEKPTHKKTKIPPKKTPRENTWKKVHFCQKDKVLNQKKGRKKKRKKCIFIKITKWKMKKSNKTKKNGLFFFKNGFFPPCHKRAYSNVYHNPIKKSVHRVFSGRLTPIVAKSLALLLARRTDILFCSIFFLGGYRAQD